MKSDHQDRPASFYHFVSVGDATRRLWLEDILLQNKIYFRQREELNDPGELRPGIVFGGKDKVRSYAKRLLARSNSKLSPAKRLLEERQLSEKLERSDAWEGILHELLGTVGIFCLTTSIQNELMWAHYADGHRGMAVEFDAGSGLFGAAQRIHYTDEPAILNALQDTQAEMLVKCMLTKRKSWSYEHEWRVLARWRDEIRLNRHLSQYQPPSELLEFLKSQHGPGHYGIPPNSVRRIVLGIRAAPDTEAWITEVNRLRDAPALLVKARFQSGLVVLD